MSIDLSTPDGEGTFAITAIQHKGKVMTTHMEGKVEGYGIVRLSHDYEHISNGGGDERANAAAIVAPDTCPSVGRGFGAWRGLACGRLAGWVRDGLRVCSVPR